MLALDMLLIVGLTICSLLTFLMDGMCSKNTSVGLAVARWLTGLWGNNVVLEALPCPRVLPNRWCSADFIAELCAPMNYCGRSLYTLLGSWHVDHLLALRRLRCVLLCRFVLDFGALGGRRNPTTIIAIVGR